MIRAAPPLPGASNAQSKNKVPNVNGRDVPGPSQSENLAEADAPPRGGRARALSAEAARGARRVDWRMGGARALLVFFW